MIKIILPILVFIALPSFANQSCRGLFEAQDQMDLVIREFYGLKHKALNTKDPIERALLFSEFKKKETEILNFISYQEFKKRLGELEIGTLESKTRVTNQERAESKTIITLPEVVETHKVESGEFLVAASDNLRFVAFSAHMKKKSPNGKVQSTSLGHSARVIREKTPLGLVDYMILESTADVIFSPQAKYFALLGNGELSVYNVAQKKEIPIPNITKMRNVESIIFSKDENQIAYTTSSGKKSSFEDKIHIYNFQTKKTVSLKNKHQIIKTLFVGNNLLVVYRNKKAELYDPKLKILIKTDAFKLEYKDSEIADFKISEDQSMIYFLEKNNGMKRQYGISRAVSVNVADWKVKSEVSLGSISLRDRITANGKFILQPGSSLDPTFRIYALAELKLMESYEIPSGFDSWLVTQDGKFMISQRNHETSPYDIKIWEWR